MTAGPCHEANIPDLESNMKNQKSWIPSVIASVCFSATLSAHAVKQSEYVSELARQYGELPANKTISTEADWRAGLKPAASWTGYPLQDGQRTTEAFNGTKDYEIGLKPKQGLDGKALLEGQVGFSPRNIEVNRKIQPRDPLREAMPAGLAHPSKSLTDSDGHLRTEVLEWINVRYRNELKSYIFGVEGKNFVKAKKITYENIWFDQPNDPNNYALKFDHQGRPLNPSPLVDENGITGHGFYFRLGQNIAVDALITFEHQGKIYAVFNQRAGEKEALAFPAGMLDIRDKSRIEAAFRELGEETGIYLNLEKISSKATLAWTGTVAGETRATRNAWTDSTLYHAHFSSLDELSEYVTEINDAYDRGEIGKRYILDLGYVVQEIAKEETDRQIKMYASHGQMLKFALGKFFHANPEKSKLLNTETNLFEAARFKFTDLREAISDIFDKK